MKPSPLISFKIEEYVRSSLQKPLGWTGQVFDSWENFVKENKKHPDSPLPKMPYIRVLGFKKECSDILADLTENAKSPVLTNLKKAPEILNEDGLALLALEKTATDLHALTYPNQIYRATNQDFTKPLVIL